MLWSVYPITSTFLTKMCYILLAILHEHCLTIYYTLFSTPLMVENQYFTSGELKNHSRSQQRPDDITCSICILHNYIVHVYYLNKSYDNELWIILYHLSIIGVTNTGFVTQTGKEWLRLLPSSSSSLLLQNCPCLKNTSTFVCHFILNVFFTKTVSSSDELMILATLSTFIICLSLFYW